MKTKTLNLLVALALVAGLVLLVEPAPVAAQGPNTIEVSLPVQVTSNSHYERGQSVLYDGSDYWLIYARSDSVTGNYGNDDPDTHDYKIYYKKASSVAGLAAATPQLLNGTHNTNLYLGETDATYFDGAVWVFASQDPDGVSSSQECNLYGWYSEDGGSSWTEVGPIVASISDGAAHFAAISFSSEIWIAYNGGTDWQALHTANPKTVDWSTLTPASVGDPGSSGTGKFYSESGTLYLALAQNSVISINEYASGSWSTADQASIVDDHAYDPTLFKVGSSYVFAYAPLPSGWSYQWLEQHAGTSLGSLLSSTSVQILAAAKYGANTWITMWPIGFTDNNGNHYLFYTSERDQPNAEGTGNIWYLEVDWDVTRDHYTYIQNAVDQAASGDTINVAAGTYDETVNIESFAGLTLNGAGQTLVSVKPSSTLCWDVGGYGCDRQAAWRVVDSTDVVLQNMTMDFDLIKDNYVHGILFWNSTGTVTNNTIQNMSGSDASGIYYEVTSYIRAPSYNHSSRASVSFTNNTVKDPGRLGIVTHDYVDATISGNTFYKTIDDFGYAIELGSESTGAISDNIIYGFDTPAASDGSNSAGIYVENSFTWDVTSSLTKDVSLTNNEIYDCQWALYIGNEFDGYAGDVDIILSMENNNLHDNLNGGVIITDEDKENGSAVSVTGDDDQLKDNGDYGYYIYTQGDGDITVNLTNEDITGHDTGLYVEDTASPSNSSYSITIHNSDIEANTNYGIKNTVSSFNVDAENNWWGNTSGPDDPTGSVEVPPCTEDCTTEKNDDGTGDTVSDYVDYCPWLTEATAITLLAFTAEPGAGEVTLAWETGTEIDNAGFNLYRAAAADGPYTQINPALIAAQGDPVAGASYSYTDAPGYGTFYYKLEDIDYYGVSALRGPVQVTLARPFRRPLHRPYVPH